MSKPGKRRPRTAERTDDSDDEAEDLRALCRALQFWRVCGKPSCRRASDCMGDALACFRWFWWRMPEEARVWVRAAIRTSAGGLGRKAAAKAADVEVVRWQDLQTRFAPKPPASTKSTQVGDATPQPAPGPRIRAL
jgi:hypothetical protein